MLESPPWFVIFCCHHCLLTLKITGNEVYSEISPTRYGGDMLAMKAMLAQAWARLAPAQQVPKLMGPDNGADDMSAEHLDGILSAGGAEAMVAATYHDYWDSCIDHQNASTLAAAGLALNVTCLDARMAATVSKFAPTTDKHQVGLWLTEGALHASSGVDGLTNVFVSSLFYAHALGQLARTGVGLFSRQTLLGGDYELINRTTGAPNPVLVAFLPLTTSIDSMSTPLGLGDWQRDY